MRVFAAVWLWLGCLTPMAAHAVSPADWKQCENSLPVAQEIAACSKILVSPGLSTPDRIKAYIARASAHQFDRDYQAAFADLTEVIKLDPGRPEQYDRRAYLMRGSGESDRAIEDFTAAIAMQPAGHRFFARGELYRAKHDFERAAADFKQAAALLSADIASYPDNAWLYRSRSDAYRNLGDIAAAVRDYDEFLARKHDGNDPRIENRGDLYVLEGDFAPAIADYTAAVDRQPDNPEFYRKRALAYRLARDYKRAILDYDRAIQWGSDDPRTWNGRGLAYAGAGKLERAILDFTTAIDLFPEYDVAFYNRGQAQRELGNLDIALADYDAAIAVNPQYSIAFNSRGRAHLAQNDIDRAISDFNQAIRLNDRFAAAYYNRAMAHQAAGRPNEAIADFGRAIAADPGDRNFLIGRGLALSATGSDQAAADDFTAALKIYPLDARAYVGRARAYLKLGALARALDDANRALVIDDSLVEAYRARADVAAAVGHQAEAASDRATAQALVKTAESRHAAGTAVKHPQLKVTIAGSFPQAPLYIKLPFKFDNRIDVNDDKVTYHIPGLQPFTMASGETFEEDFAGLCNNRPTTDQGHRSVTAIFDKYLIQVEFHSRVDFTTGACRGKFVYYNERFVVDVADGGCKFSYWQHQDLLGNPNIDRRVSDQACVVETTK